MPFSFPEPKLVRENFRGKIFISYVSPSISHLQLWMFLFLCSGNSANSSKLLQTFFCSKSKLFDLSVINFRTKYWEWIKMHEVRKSTSISCDSEWILPSLSAPTSWRNVSCYYDLSLDALNHIFITLIKNNWNWNVGQ